MCALLAINVIYFAAFVWFLARSFRHLARLPYDQYRCGGRRAWSNANRCEAARQLAWASACLPAACAAAAHPLTSSPARPCVFWQPNSIVRPPAHPLTPPLDKKPCVCVCVSASAHRQPNFIVRLHARLRGLSIAFFVLSVVLYTLLSLGTCRSYLLSWLGFLPVQLVGLWTGGVCGGFACAAEDRCGESWGVGGCVRLCTRSRTLLGVQERGAAGGQAGGACAPCLRLTLTHILRALCTLPLPPAALLPGHHPHLPHQCVRHDPLQAPPGLHPAGTRACAGARAATLAHASAGQAQAAGQGATPGSDAGTDAGRRRVVGQAAGPRWSHVPACSVALSARARRGASQQLHGSPPHAEAPSWTCCPHAGTSGAPPPPRPCRCGSRSVSVHPPSAVLLRPHAQVWLQEFAWSEAELPKRRQQRASSLPPGSEKAVKIDREPMFCVEVRGGAATATPRAGWLRGVCSRRSTGTEKVACWLALSLLFMLPSCLRCRHPPTHPPPPHPPTPTLAQTALKALYWATLVYDHEEVRRGGEGAHMERPCVEAGRQSSSSAPWRGASPGFRSSATDQ